MQDVVIVAATRTAIGSFQGSLAEVPAPELPGRASTPRMHARIWMTRRLLVWLRWSVCE